MDSHDRLPRSAAAPVRAALGPSPIAESREPASATAPSPPVSTRQRLTPHSSSNSTRQQNISMLVPRPHDQPISIRATPEEVLETSGVRLPHWSIFGLVSRNPLVWRSDRIEALVLALAITVSLLAMPLASAV